MLKKNKIVLTGGHAGTTALATIEELKKSELNWNIVWIGVEKAIEGKDAKTLEFKIFPSEGVKCLPLIAGRIQRKWTRYTIPSLMRIPIGFVHAFILLNKIKPKIVISYGGFAAFPVVIAAFLSGIPIILHEQTVAVGLANKLSGFFATKIALAREESKVFFPQRKTIIVGNPLLSSVISSKPKTTIGKNPCIFLFGGSRGSQIINSTFEEIIPKLLPEFKVIHQTGDLDFNHFKNISDNLTSKLKDKYEIISFIDPRNIGSIYEKADIVICRAGANTVAELIYLQRPSIIIPIPWTRFDEQTKNAKLAESFGIARVINQKDLTPERLFSEIRVVLENWDSMSKVKDNYISNLDQLAAHKLVREVEVLVS